MGRYARRKVAAAASLVALMVIALDAQAPPEALYACVNPGNGMMRLVARTEVCRPNESRIQWNIAGERGPRGEPGPQGLQGLPGVPGQKGDPGTTPDLTAILSRLAALETRVAQLEGPPPPPPPPPSGFADCKAIKTATPAAPDGTYAIDPDGQGSFYVWCDMTTDGGGWTVFQRRQDGSVDFYRDWATYAAGFGTLSGEHWLGNEKLARLTRNSLSTLRVDLTRPNGDKAFARYRDVRISGEDQDYTFGGIFVDGTAGDSLSSSSGRPFSTHDRDLLGQGCPINYQSGWWHCGYSNLNGPWLPRPNQVVFLRGVNWVTLGGYFEGLTFTEMKLRR